MDYIRNIQSSQIMKYYPVDSALICFASFEERCYTLAQKINSDMVTKAYVLRNKDSPMKQNNELNTSIIRQKLEKIVIEEISLNYPISIAEKLFSVFKDICDNGIRKLSVDITTFTHEALLMLLNVLFSNRSNFESITLFYNGASEYSSWLSKGCKEIRNVIGYPGLFNPSYKNHMIILTGFEQERATRLVELFEPDILSIGCGSDPTDENHINIMKDMKDKFNKWLDNLGNIHSNSFDFSCSNIKDTMNILSDIISREENQNYILVPLNTKLSTISVALTALKNKKIQVIYPVPETYNLSYSKPGDSFTMIDLTKIMELYN